MTWYTSELSELSACVNVQSWCQEWSFRSSEDVKDCEGDLMVMRLCPTLIHQWHCGLAPSLSVATIYKRYAHLEGWRLVYCTSSREMEMACEEERSEVTYILYNNASHICIKLLYATINNSLWSIYWILLEGKLGLMSILKHETQSWVFKIFNQNFNNSTDDIKCFW